MITISFNGIETSVGFGKDDRSNPNYESEAELLNKWLPLLKERYNLDFEISQRSTNYTSLEYQELAFIRLKYSPKAKWLSIPIFNPKKYENDERFSSEKNKNQFYWKSNLKDEDITKYYDVLDEALQLYKKNSN